MCAPCGRLDHARQEDLHAVDHALEVDVDLPVPVVIAGLLDGPKLADAGRIAQQLHRPEDALGFVGGAGVGRAVGDVELDGVDGQLLGGEVRAGLRQMILAHVDDHHAHAGFLGQHLRLPQAHPGAATGDEGHFALQFFHISPCGVPSIAR